MHSNKSVKKMIERTDPEGLSRLLEEKPHLANEGITIPFKIACREKAHPLHRICDAVFSRKVSDYEGVELAKVFMENGARIDGDKDNNKGTPLLAAASLHAEQVGIYYIDQGADIHNTYQNDGVTPLHWAAYCGLDLLVARLIQAGANVNGLENQYKATPLGWALHSLQSKDEGNHHHQLDCIQLLLENGADVTKLDKEKQDFLRDLTRENK